MSEKTFKRQCGYPKPPNTKPKEKEMDLIKLMTEAIKKNERYKV